MKKRVKICVGGYAGCGNLGDDVLLVGFLRGIFERGVYPSEVILLSGRPKKDQKRFGVRCVGRKNPFAVLLAFLRTDWFVLGGGTLLQNRTGNRSLFYYLFLLRLARLCGCQTVCCGGVGPIEGGFARRRTGRELDRCKMLLLRDVDSAALAGRMGVQKPAVRVGADPAFLLPPPPALRCAWLRRQLTGDLQTPYVCVCPCKGVSLRGVEAYLQKHVKGVRPVYLLCHPKKDLPAARRLQGRFGGVEFSPREASDAMAALAGANLVLSCRLHPLILSVRVGTPCICFFGGDPKLSSFCRAAGIPLLPAEKEDFSAREPTLSRPDAAPFCKTAAKDLAFFCKMVYNEGRKAPKRNGTGERRHHHEKRAACRPAPPGKL